MNKKYVLHVSINHVDTKNLKAFKKKLNIPFQAFSSKSYRTLIFDLLNNCSKIVIYQKKIDRQNKTKMY